MISREWKGDPHGRRAQRKPIVYILKELELYEALAVDSPPSMEIIFQSCHSMKCPKVSVQTLRRWWEIYMEWGELPYCVKKRKERMKGYGKNMRVDDDDLLKLK